MFGKVGQKRNHVVLCDGLNLINAGNIKFYVFCLPNGICVFARNHTKIGHRIAGMGFNLVPNAEF